MPNWIKLNKFCSVDHFSRLFTILKAMLNRVSCFVEIVPRHPRCTFSFSRSLRAPNGPLQGGPWQEQVITSVQGLFGRTRLCWFGFSEISSNSIFFQFAVISQGPERAKLRFLQCDQCDHDPLQKVLHVACQRSPWPWLLNLPAHCSAVYHGPQGYTRTTLATSPCRFGHLPLAWSALGCRATATPSAPERTQSAADERSTWENRSRSMKLRSISTNGGFLRRYL